MLLHLPNKKGAYMAGVSMNKFEQFVENAYRGIPEQTSTVEEKEKAIAAKKKILQYPNCPKKLKPHCCVKLRQLKAKLPE